MKSILLPCIASALLAQTTIEQSLNFKTGRRRAFRRTGGSLPTRPPKQTGTKTRSRLKYRRGDAGDGRALSAHHAKKSSSDVHWAPERKTAWLF